MYINRKIERFLIEHNYPATKFGRNAIGDPRLLRDIRNGRQLKTATVMRIESFMAAYKAALAAQLEQTA
jgi:hypothetical protein